jgi:hypothetical protein
MFYTRSNLIVSFERTTRLGFVDSWRPVVGIQGLSTEMVDLANAQPVAQLKVSK